MELRDWIAVAGLTYGVASDWIGESARFQSNSVAGVAWRWLRSQWGRGEQPASLSPAPAVRTPDPPSCAKLLEDGIYHRHRLMRQPGVQEVEMALMGRYLVLTVYREGRGDA